MFFYILSFFLLNSVIAEEKKTDLVKISEALGHLIGKNLQELGVPFDLKAVILGLQEEALGKESPLAEEECLLALSQIQDESYNKIAEKNLKEAEDFLVKNKQKDKVVSLKDGKIQYEILQKGEGPAIKSYGNPLVRYRVQYINGPSISETEEIIDLDQAMIGLKEVLVGMKAKEKRIAYIHPDFGYGSKSHTHPNALVMFEVEVLKTDASTEAHTASNQQEVAP